MVTHSRSNRKFDTGFANRNKTDGHWASWLAKFWRFICNPHHVQNISKLSSIGSLIFLAIMVIWQIGLGEGIEYRAVFNPTHSSLIWLWLRCFRDDICVEEKDSSSFRCMSNFMPSNQWELSVFPASEARGLLLCSNRVLKTVFHEES